MIMAIASTGTQNAVANGDTRTLKLYHTHTRETLTITFKKSGRYDEAALKQLNWFLRDWRSDQLTKMEPRLFDVVWEAYREVDGSSPIHIVSAYRSPATNNMLRSRSRGVAKHSQHTLGRAMDFFIPGVPVSAVREVGLRLQRGGVGYYPTSGSPFVHLDVGNVRHWPRMTRSQLARVFPDGKTVHLPADGRPMPGYDQALAELQRNGSSVGRRFDFSGRATATAEATPRGRSLLARLLGTDAEEDEEIATTPAPAAAAPALAGRSRMPAAQEEEAAPAAAPAPAPVPVAAVAPPARVPVPRAKPAEIVPVQVAAAPVPEYVPPAPAPAPAPKGPAKVWVQGPAPLAFAPAATSANPLAAPVAAPLAAVSSPMPRPKPAAIGGPKPAPVQIAAVGADITLPAAAPVAAPSVGNATAMSIANRIAGATGLLARKPAQQIAATEPAAPAPAAASKPNPLFAVANRIAVAAAPASERSNPRLVGVTGSTVRADFSGKLPESYFAERVAVRDRIALAYASSDISIAPARLTEAAPVPRSRAAAPAAAAVRHRQSAEALVTAKLDEAGWRAVLQPIPAASAGDAVFAPRPEESASLLLVPARAMPFGFGTDPAYGCVSGRFAGYPVMFIRTIDLAGRSTQRSVN